MNWFKIIQFLYIAAIPFVAIYGLHRYFIIYLYYRHRREKLKPKDSFKELPTITIQLPIYKERYVVERLIDSICALEYPQERLQIQVLDDSKDETHEIIQRKVEEKKRLGYDISHICRENRDGYKAGALQNGLHTAKGSFIAIFDADFIPQPDLLKETIHYFTDLKIGMIQTRWGHLNEKFSLLTRLQSLFLDAHLLIEQTARHRSGRFFNFNGTAGIWRRQAIDDAGGWNADTLTEDLDLSYRAQLKGWQFVFLNDVVTPSELPVEMGAFKSQQHRWTKGAIQTSKKMVPLLLKSHLPWWIKLEGLIHLTSNLAYLPLVLLCLLIQPVALANSDSIIANPVLNLVFFSATTLSLILFYLYAQKELHGWGWFKRVFYLPALMGFGVGMSLNNSKAVLEALFNHNSEFVRTPKYGIRNESQNSSIPNQRLQFKALLPWFEIAFGVYYTFVTWECLQIGNWLTVPFLVLCQFGFFYVGLLSLSENWLQKSFLQRVRMEF